MPQPSSFPPLGMNVLLNLGNFSILDTKVFIKHFGTKGLAGQASKLKATGWESKSHTLTS